MPRRYRVPLFVWKTGKLLVNIHKALSDKWEVRMHPMGEMVEFRINPGGQGEPLTLNVNVMEGKALWAYIDLPILSDQDDFLNSITEQLKSVTEATIGPVKKRVKFKFEGESIETETTTADVYSWVLNYGLLYSLSQITRFLTAIDAAIREHGGRALEGNEFFVTYRAGSLHLQENSLSFVLITPWGYYSAFLSVGEEALELQIVDEETEDFPADQFEKVVQTAVSLFESDKEIRIQEAA